VIGFIGGVLSNLFDFGLERAASLRGSLFEPRHDFVVQISDKDLCHLCASFPSQRV
jgi:hypothetical protein